MIRLEGVSKRFRTPGGVRTVMERVTLEFPRGRSVGLLGRNGAGKSTLLAMIAGNVQPDEGVIRREARISWPLGFGGGFHPALTGVQNARFIARIYGVDTDDMVASVQAFAELGDYLRMPVGQYSSGMKARLAFAVSMAIDFEIYLVDEIVAVGDASFREKCARAFKEKAERADVIMVSHSPGVIKQHCDAGVVLEQGRLEYYDDVNEAVAIHEARMKQPHPAPR
jgi:capsular polysaccharide transport system ATP-binding protein